MTGPATTLHIPDPDDRGDLGTFVGRVVRLDPTAVVRLRATDTGRVTAWASTPFDVLATRSVLGSLEPADVTTFATSLLSALSVDRSDAVDPGTGGLWQGLLPPEEGWESVDAVPAAELEGLTERGLALAREHAGPLGPPTSLLDQTVLTVSGAAGSGGPDGGRAVAGGICLGAAIAAASGGEGDDLVEACAMEVGVAVWLQVFAAADSCIGHDRRSAARLVGSWPVAVAAAAGAGSCVEGVVRAELVPDLMGHIVDIERVADRARATCDALSLER